MTDGRVGVFALRRWRLLCCMAGLFLAMTAVTVVRAEGVGTPQQAKTFAIFACPLPDEPGLVAFMHQQLAPNASDTVAAMQSGATSLQVAIAGPFAVTGQVAGQVTGQVTGQAAASPVVPDQNASNLPSMADSGLNPNPNQNLDPTDSATHSLWGRLRAGFGMTHSDNPRIAAQMDWFARHPDYLARTVQRSKRYLYHIVNEVQKRGMPTEIALLPMIESAYNPMAYSTSHAAGIWQFLPSTAKHFGLRETGNYDGRLDVLAATDAALNYLSRLHQQFGSWELSLAAYNCGEGCVQHAIARNQALGLPTDYQSLHLPPETRDYVPKLLALKRIVANPQNAGVDLGDIPDQAYFTTVTVDRPMDVSLAAKLANMPVKDFISLNSAWDKPVIRSDTPAQLLLPVDKADTFSNNLNQYDKPLVSWHTCQAGRGQSERSVATHCHASVAELKKYNHLQLGRKSRFKTAQMLWLPSVKLHKSGLLEVDYPVAGNSGNHTDKTVQSPDDTSGASKTATSHKAPSRHPAKGRRHAAPHHPPHHSAPAQHGKSRHVSRHPVKQHHGKQRVAKHKAPQ